MRTSNYTATPGLESFPQQERLAVYRAAHKRLMREDAAYRRQWNSYVIGIVCVSIIPATNLFIGGVLALVLTAVELIAVVLGVIYLAFRQQRFMNRKIGAALQDA
jgi:hypothetical protein